MGYRLYPSLWARIMANSVPLANGCWEWTGGLSTSGSYPQMSLRPAGEKHRTARVHRLVAEIVLGRPLEPNETIEHDCLTTRCISPHCFLLATASDNSKSMQNRRRGVFDDAKLRMIRLVPDPGENPHQGRFWHYAEPIPF